MIITSIRHLATELNSKGLLQGRLDIPIDRDNIDQRKIQLQKFVISNLKPEAVFVSPLIRTIETCELYGFNDYIIDDRLIEYNFGNYEGKPKSEMLTNEGHLWLNDFPEITFGEGFKAIQYRLDDFLNEVQKKYNNVLLFSHGVVIRYLMAKAYMSDFNFTNRLFVQNNAMTILNFES